MPPALEGPLRIELERALSVADRANNAVLQERDGRWLIQGDPTEGALVVAARKAGLKTAMLQSRLERVAEVPFSSERKLMSTVHTDAQNDAHLLVFTKGAPDVLLARCARERVGADVGARFAPGSVTGLVDLLADVDDRPEVYLAKGSRGRRHYEENFGPERDVEELLEIYRFAVARPVTPGRR